MTKVAGGSSLKLAASFDQPVDLSLVVPSELEDYVAQKE
jgi:hypothetical protein